jgi:hypothetical protein
MSWARTYRLGNRAAQRWYGTASIVYTDTTGHVDTVRAIFDEAYQLVGTGEDGVEFTMTRPVLSVRYADFVNATLEADSRVVIGSRTFVVDGVERTGYEDARLILQEVTA